jgi:hypothetical protein
MCQCNSDSCNVAATARAISQWLAAAAVGMALVAQVSMT